MGLPVRHSLLAAILVLGLAPPGLGVEASTDTATLDGPPVTITAEQALEIARLDGLNVGAPRFLLTARAMLDGVEDRNLRSRALLEEWRASGTVEGLAVNGTPGPQHRPLIGPSGIRIVGGYCYPANSLILAPHAYLDSGAFDVVQVRVTPQWPEAWYRRLMSDIGPGQALVIFDWPKDAPDFDGVKAFLDEHESKVWAVSVNGEACSNLVTWHRPGRRLSNGEFPDVDPQYAETVSSIHAMTNYINAKWPDLPTLVFFCENRYTDHVFEQSLGFEPGAFLRFSLQDYEWGAERLTLSQFGREQAKPLAVSPPRTRYPRTPIILHGQRVHLKRAPGRIAEADQALLEQVDSIFTDAVATGYAGASLIISR